jgi:signal transduction histidine kinase/ligand-binding sensor domain-containing protein
MFLPPTKCGRDFHSYCVCKKTCDNEADVKIHFITFNKSPFAMRRSSKKSGHFLSPVLLLIFFLAIGNSALAQQYPIKNYNVDDGLSHSNVYRIFEDKRGFLWFCTDYGLCTYDGKSFNTYENDSLLNGAILSISEDDGGKKLISSLKEGIVVLTDSTSQRKAMPENSSLSQVLYAVYKNKRIWAISRESGQYLYEVTDNTVRLVPLQTASGTPVVFNRMVETEGELLLASNQGVYQVADTIVKPFLREIVPEAVQDIKKSSNGTYWVAAANKVLEIKNNRIVHSYHLEPQQLVSTILCDKSNRVWVALYGEGVLLIENGNMENITAKLAIRSTLINDIQEDREGNIWIATYDAGVYKLPTLDVLNYSISNQKYHHLLCNSLEKYRDETLLIGTMGAALFWKNGETTPVAAIGPDEFVYFVKSQHDSVYIGTSRHFYLVRNNKIEKTYRYAGKDFSAISFCKDSRNRIWVGNYRGLYHLEGENIVPDTALLQMRSKRINVIAEDARHQVWFGTRSGLIKYDGKQFTEMELPASKNFQNIHDIKQDSHNRVWLATEGGLLCLQNNNAWKIFTALNGLTHNKCNSIAEDSHNTLWVGTLRGLSHLDLNTLEIRRYGGGIYPKEVISLYCSDRNLLFVGTAEGLSSIKTNRVAVDNSPPPLYITGIKTPDQTIGMPASVSLSYSNNKLLINFIGLSFNSTNAVEYRYKILGIDPNWHYTLNNSLELPSLPSGKFTFVLNARKNKGAWGPDAILNIRVSTPFWRTWWFITCVLALLVAITIKIVRTRQGNIHRKKTQVLLTVMNAKLEKRAEALAASNKELEQFAYIVSHDLQEPLRMVTSFMTLLENKYQGELDEKGMQYIYYARDGAERMRNIILDLLEYSRAGRVREKTSVDLNAVAEQALALNMAMIREKNAVIHVKDLPVIVGDAPGLQRLFQNLVANSLKYQKKDVPPIIHIRASENETHWQIEVEDNGIGIDSQYFDKIFIMFQRLHTREELSGTGIGLAICKKVVENHGGQIWLTSQPGEGTTFYFTLSKTLIFF